MNPEELLPLPTPALYQIRYSEYEDYITEIQNNYNEIIGAPKIEWDAWVDVMNTTMAAKMPSQDRGYQNPLHNQLLNLAMIGINFERFEDVEASQRPIVIEDSVVVSEPRKLMYRNQTAFAQGYLQQQYIIDRIYKGGISFYSTFTSVVEALNEDLPDVESPQERHEVHRRVVEKMGVQGLMAMGYARGFIEKWAHEVYPGESQLNNSRRHAFRNGHGVALRGSIIYHEQVNDYVISNMDLDDISLDALVNPNTDSTRDTE